MVVWAGVLSSEDKEESIMRLSLRAILLMGAVLLFVLALVTEEQSSDFLTVGLALFAGAFLVEDLGVGRRWRVGR